VRRHRVQAAERLGTPDAASHTGEKAAAQSTEEPLVPELLSYDFAKLLDPNRGAPPADVCFHVGTESFSAHRFVL
jgi:hypothetical protein